MTSIEKAIEKLQKSNGQQKSPVVPHNTINYSIDETINSARSERHEIINFNRLDQLGMIVPGGPDNLIVEEYRHIKRPLLQNAFGKSAHIVDSGNLILVTSSVPGEGKTFTAVNLALSIAMEMDKTVLLVDADISMCGVSRTLGIDVGVGLANILAENNFPLQQALIKTNISNLTILTAGKYDGRKAEFISSDHMKALVVELSRRYPDRIIIIDGPPIMATSEARVLAGLVGQIVFVVEANKTSQQTVQQALSFLDKSKAIGLVLNKSTGSMASSYGYYGYGPKK